MDPGATAIDNEDGDLSSQIQVTGQVDTNNPGSYELNYSVSDLAGNTSVSIARVVVVAEPHNESDSIPPDLVLFGKSVVNLLKGDPYEEQGFQAFDNKDGDITDMIEVSGK